MEHSEFLVPPQRTLVRSRNEPLKPDVGIRLRKIRPDLPTWPLPFPVRNGIRGLRGVGLTAELVVKN